MSERVARLGLSKRTRFEVFKRDGFVCQYCGAHPPDSILEVDHIIPVCEGGGSDVENLVTACFNCNRGKAGISLTSIPQSLAERAEEIHEREAQLIGYREIVQAREDRIEDDKWRVADTLVVNASVDGMRRDWLQSIKRFNTLLELHEVLEAAEIARTKVPHSEVRRFKYFCGVCWTKIRNADHADEVST